MKLNSRVLPFAFLLLIVKLLSAQDTTEAYFTKAQLTNDVQLMNQAFYDIHPKFIDTLFQLSMQKHTNDLLAKLPDSMSSADFHILLRRHYVRHIECGHTAAFPSKSWYTEQAKEPLLLPFEVYILEDRMFVKQSFEKDSILLPGTEILSVNTRSATEILLDMQSIQHRDEKALSYVDANVQKLFRTYHLFLYGGSKSYDVTYRKGMSTHHIQLAGGQKPESTKHKAAYLDSTLVQKKIYGPNAAFYLLNTTQKTAVLDLNSFSSRKYKKFYKEVFKALDNHGTEHLIIDLRGNGGGYFLNGNELLSYLLNDDFDFHFYAQSKEMPKGEHYALPRSSKLTIRAFNLMPDRDKDDPRRNYRLKKKIKKKNHYNKQVYVLTDGFSFSLSGYVSSVLEEKTEALFIGTETGGGASGSNAIINYMLTLPNSGIRVNIPHYHIDHQRVSPSERGVVPDHTIHYSLEDLLKQRDKEMEFVMKMIAN